MPVATDEHFGNEELIYVANTAPTYPDETNDAAYDALGMTTGHSIASQADTITLRSKQGQLVKVGQETSTMTVSALTSYEGDDAQSALRAAHFADPKTLIYILATSGVTGQRNVQVQGYVTSYNDESPLDGAATVSFTLAVTSITFAVND